VIANKIIQRGRQSKLSNEEISRQTLIIKDLQEKVEIWQQDSKRKDRLIEGQKKHFEKLENDIIFKDNEFKSLADTLAQEKLAHSVTIQNMENLLRQNCEIETCHPKYAKVSASKVTKETSTNDLGNSNENFLKYQIQEMENSARKVNEESQLAITKLEAELKQGQERIQVLSTFILSKFIKL
jgi:hypothetical protein